MHTSNEHTDTKIKNKNFSFYLQLLKDLKLGINLTKYMQKCVCGKSHSTDDRNQRRSKYMQRHAILTG